MDKQQTWTDDDIRRAEGGWHEQRPAWMIEAAQKRLALAFEREIKRIVEEVTGEAEQ